MNTRAGEHGVSASTGAVPSHFRCGYIAIVGRPNTGKSSLFNELVGVHISGVSPKAQTTRVRVMGWMNLHREQGSGQLVFLDTPGLAGSGQYRRQSGLKQQTLAVFEFADVLVMMADCRGWREGDEEILSLIKTRFSGPVLLVLNKIDLLANKRELLPLLAAHAQRWPWQEILPISVKRRDGLGRLVQAVWQRLPQSPPYYSLEASTLQSQEAIVVERIRESVYRYLHQEIPYRITVVLRGIDERDGAVHVHACIGTDRRHHSRIVIGRGGKTLALIRRSSEIGVQEYFGDATRVFVHLDVASGRRFRAEQQSETTSP